MKIIVHAKPSAREEKVEKIDEGTYRVSVIEPPVQGRANAAILKVLAQHFDVAQSQVRIVSGHTARKKVVVIE